jgi:hypothetical protein
MGFMGIALTHAIAEKYNKPPFFFSRFNFTRMKEYGNDHYCFDCGGDVGFSIGANNYITNTCRHDSRYNPMKEHDISHEDAVVGNADKYDNVWDWLHGEIDGNFPYIVNVPSIM